MSLVDNNTVTATLVHYGDSNPTPKVNEMDMYVYTDALVRYNNYVKLSLIYSTMTMTYSSHCH